MKKLLPAFLALSAIVTPLAVTAPAVANSASRAMVDATAPEYPRGAERRGIEGSVTISFAVEADGSVADAQVVASTPEGVFDRAALAAVEQWRFEPGNSRTEGHSRSLDFRLSD